MATEKWMNMTRNQRKSYPRISSFIIAKEGSDVNGVLFAIHKNSSSSRKNNDEDGGGDDYDDDNNNNNNNNNNTLLSVTQDSLVLLLLINKAKPTKF
jgi:hypothetical protein